MEGFKQNLLKKEMNKKRGEVIKIAGRPLGSSIEKPSFEDPSQQELSGVSNLTTSLYKSILNKSGNFNQTNAGIRTSAESNVPASVTEASVARKLPQQEIASSPTSKTLTNFQKGRAVYPPSVRHKACQMSPAETFLLVLLIIILHQKVKGNPLRLSCLPQVQRVLGWA